MELNILSKTDKELEVEFKGETHTLLNMLRANLVADERVEIVYYDMKHVSISDPILFIKTDGTNPIQVLRDAASTLVSECEEFTEVFSKAVNA